MVDYNLAYQESIDLEDRWNESVLFAIEINTFEAFPFVYLQGAAAVVDTVMHDQTAKKIGPSAGKTLH